MSLLLSGKEVPGQEGSAGGKARSETGRGTSGLSGERRKHCDAQTQTHSVPGHPPRGAFPSLTPLPPLLSSYTAIFYKEKRNNTQSLLFHVDLNSFLIIDNSEIFLLVLQ